MAPEYYKALVNLAIEHRIKTGSSEKFDERLLSEMEDHWRRLVKRWGDRRSGEETYGYKDEENIRGNLGYISDRWNCAFRIRWIIDGVRSGKI